MDVVVDVGITTDDSDKENYFDRRIKEKWKEKVSQEFLLRLRRRSLQVSRYFFLLLLSSSFVVPSNFVSCRNLVEMFSTLDDPRLRIY